MNTQHNDPIRRLEDIMNCFRDIDSDEVQMVAHCVLGAVEDEILRSRAKDLSVITKQAEILSGMISTLPDTDFMAWNRFAGAFQIFRENVMDALGADATKR